MQNLKDLNLVFLCTIIIMINITFGKGLEGIMELTAFVALCIPYLY